jgi:hypothetical protein
VDSWWVEGNRACVVVRGINHIEGDEEDPPMNSETIWEFSLRLTKERWVIRTFLESRPNAGERSLPKSKKPWLKRWRSGKVE